MTLETYRKGVREAKRKAIVEAALAGFLRDGYARSTIDGVAVEAGVSLATLYKHFPTKADLFGGVMQDTWSRWVRPEALPDAALATREGLRRIGMDYATLLKQPMMVPLFRVLIAEVETFPELGRELYERGKKPWLDHVERFLKREHRAGRLKCEDPVLATRQFAGMINDVLYWPRFLVPSLVVDERETVRVVEEAVETFLARYGLNPPRNHPENASEG